jgi:hypothetical protein
VIILLHPPARWDYRPIPPHPVSCALIYLRSLYGGTEKLVLLQEEIVTVMTAAIV